MKKLLLALGLITLLATPVMAADIVVSITIPDAYVTPLTNMVTDKWLNTSACMSTVGECSDAQYEDQETCVANEETWSYPPLTLKQCFIKKMITESIIADYRQWLKEAGNKTARDNFAAASTAADEASEVAEFEVTGE